MTKEVVTELEYEIVCKVANFGFLVRKWEKTDIIDYDGKPNISLYDKYNILTNQNELLLNNWVNELSFDLKEKYCIIGIDSSKYGVFDLKGNLLIKPIYDKLYYDSDDVFMAVANDKFGFVNSKRQMTPIIFTNVSFFYENYAAVKYNYKWGFINKETIIENPDYESEYVIAPQFDSVDDFENGLCKVKKDDEVFYIDKLGNKVEQKIKVKH